MKKILLSILAMAGILLLLTSCGPKKSKQAAVPTPVDELIDYLNESVTNRYYLTIEEDSPNVEVSLMQFKGRYIKLGELNLKYPDYILTEADKEKLSSLFMEKKDAWGISDDELNIIMKSIEGATDFNSLNL